MNKISVDPFTFEVARALYRDLLLKIHGEITSDMTKYELVAIIFALDWFGFLITEYPLGQTRFSFAKDLEQLRGIPDQRVKELIAHPILLTLNNWEWQRAREVFERYRDNLHLGEVKGSWRGVRAIIDRILKGELRLVGPETKEGLIVQDLTRGDSSFGDLVWLSLDKTSKTPSLIDLKGPLFFKSEPLPLRIPIRAAAAASKHGREFVTLGPPIFES